jgi:tetratricopeptide (TPR) repeat protein
VHRGDDDALETATRLLDAVEADLAAARGQILHARFLRSRVESPDELPLFERAFELYRALGDGRGEGAALFFLAMYHQVVRGDDAAAIPLLERSLELSTAAGDGLTRSEALRHLGIAEHRAGRLAAARELLEESTRIRRELGLTAGVASNLVGLGYVAAADGRPDDARAILDEAAALAEESGAAAIAAHVEEARASLL